MSYIAVVQQQSGFGFIEFREYSIISNKSNFKNVYSTNNLLSDLIAGNYRKFSRKMAPILAPKVKLNNGYEMPVLGLGTYEVSFFLCRFCSVLFTFFIFSVI